jgi:Cft2 family RNA processing exonuclease
VARIRARITPIPTQVERRYREVAQAGAGLVSALRLEPHVEAPRGQTRRVTLNHIHRALHRLWADGHLVAFCDADGAFAREKEFGEPGSAAVAHPQVFALPGATLPEGAVREVRYQERHDVPRYGGADEPDGADAPPSGANQVGGDESAPCPAVARAVTTATSRYPQAPEWLDDALISSWLSQDVVFRSIRGGLDAAPVQHRAQLITVGLTRTSTLDEPLLRKLVSLCRRHEYWWQRLIDFALRDADDRGDFAEAWAYLDGGAIGDGSAFSPTVLPLVAFASEMSDDLVRVTCEEALQQVREHERVSLSELVDALTEQLADERIEAREARREAQSLRRELERATARTKGVEERLAAERRNQAREESDAESRVRGLEAELDDLRDQLGNADADRAALAEENQGLMNEHSTQREQLSALTHQVDALERQRLEAEGKLQDAYGEQRALLGRIKRLDSDAGIPQPDDPAELARYLTRAVSGLSERALARLADGNPEEIDGLVLDLAGEIARFSRRLRDHVPPPAPEAAAADAEEDGEVRSAEQEVPDAEMVPAPVPGQEVLDVGPEAEALTLKTAEVIELALDGAASEGAEAAEARALARAIATPRGTWTVDVLGGAQEVGASAILATAPSGAAVLLDCGQRVRGVYGDDTAPNLYHSRVTQSDRVRAIVVSHAHIDHIGSLPTLHPVQEAVQGHPIPIYMSSPSIELADLMLCDAAKVQASRAASIRELADTEWATHFDERTAYEMDDVRAVMESVEQLFPYQRHTIPGTEITVELVPVPHILGACAVILREADASFGYTGDLGPIAEPQLTLPTFNGVEAFPTVDVLVMEGTQGLARPGDALEVRSGGRRREQAISEFGRLATRTIAEREGSLLIPAFALGRTQEVLRILDEHMGQHFPKAPVYIGGLGQRICDVYDDRRHETMPGGGRWLERGQFARTDNLARWMARGETFADVADRVLAAEPGYIVASPGMLGAGWSQTFAERMVDDSRHAVAHVGFIRERREVRRGQRFLCHDGRRLEVRAETARIPVSAHAARQDLVALAEEAARRRPGLAIGLVHGDVRALRSLAETLGTTSGVGEAQVLVRAVTWRPTPA